MPFEPVGRQFCCSDNAFEGDPLGKEYRCQHHQALDGNRLAVSLLIFKDEPEEIDVGLAFREKDAHAFFIGFGIVWSRTSVDKTAFKNQINASPCTLGKSQSLENVR